MELDISQFIEDLSFMLEDAEGNSELAGNISELRSELMSAWKILMQLNEVKK